MDHIEESVEHLAALQREHLRRATRSQRLANSATRALSRPLSVIFVTIAVAVWVLGNAGADRIHLRAVEQSPFPELALVLGFVAVVVALLILTTQRHSEELAERRSELTLQIALLSERKVAKLIELLEEQRRDNPMLTSRVDVEAEQMAAPADPQSTLGRIEAAKPDESI